MNSITIDVELNGSPTRITFPPDALCQVKAALAPQVELTTETMIEGYTALSRALAGVGVNRHPKTLNRWAMAGKLPHMRFGNRPRFYLSQVLKKLEGKR